MYKPRTASSTRRLRRPLPCGAPLHGRTAIVTGASSGIGLAVARELARRGARVIVATRSAARGEAAARSIRTETGNPQVLFMHLDLASLRSVRAFASAVLRQEPRLHLLINNAGVSAGGRTEDGYGLTFQVNHLGHFLLTQLLLGLLQRSAPSRVVLVASLAHCAGRLQPRALARAPRGALGAFRAYCDSKLANVLHARELAARLRGTRVTCYAAHPGFVDTRLFRHAPLWLRPLLAALAALAWREAGAGAETPLFCATRDGIEHLSGRYFSGCRPRAPWGRGADEGLARALWEASERLVGLAPQ
ncbi:dehydrogenase/reductase SDR family member 13 [Eudromia elegans]